MFDTCKTGEDIFSLDVSFMRSEMDDRNPEPFPIMGEGGKLIGIAIKRFILMSTWAEYFECFLPAGETMVQTEHKTVFPTFWIKKR